MFRRPLGDSECPGKANGELWATFRRPFDTPGPRNSNLKTNICCTLL